MELRDYQEACLLNTYAALENHDSVAVVMPTGSGKTAVFGAMVRKFLAENKYGKVVIVSHLSLLVSQTKDRFKQDWNIDSGILQAKEMPKEDDRVIITTMQSFRVFEKLTDWMNKQRTFGTTTDMNDLQVKMIIVDECHYMGCASYEKIMGYFRSTSAKVIGFTATPFRGNKLMTNIFSKVAYTMSMQELIDDGYLVPPKLHLTQFNPLDETSMYLDIVDIYKKYHDGKKAVVYLQTIEDCKNLRNVLVQTNIPASAITSDIDKELRDVTLSKYRENDDIKILVTCDVLTAGFDSPNIEVIFMPFKVNSVTTYLQRVGRGLRINGGKTCCHLYVGADSPGIKKGFWEKINDRMLHAAKETYERYDEELDFNEGLSEEVYKWTKEIVKMAEKYRTQGNTAIAELIMKKEFPSELLDVFIKEQMVGGAGKFSSPTQKQYDMLIRLGLYHDGLSKKECSYIIDSYKRSQGYEYPKDEIVPSGIHAGKHFKQVPWMYWKILGNKASNSGVYKSYLEYKEKIRRS